MPRIQTINRAGWNQRKRKINEIVEEVNALLNIRMLYSKTQSTPSIQYSSQSVTITIPDLRDQISDLQQQINNLQAQINSYHP